LPIKGFALKSLKVPHLIHTGLQPGDPKSRQSEEPFQRFLFPPRNVTNLHSTASQPLEQEETVKTVPPIFSRRSPPG
jgi:hypothetical protein